MSVGAMGGGAGSGMRPYTQPLPPPPPHHHQQQYGQHHHVQQQQQHSGFMHQHGYHGRGGGPGGASGYRGRYASNQYRGHGGGGGGDWHQQQQQYGHMAASYKKQYQHHHAQQQYHQSAHARDRRDGDDRPDILYMSYEDYVARCVLCVYLYILLLLHVFVLYKSNAIVFLCI